jgi:hypothetical protein
MKKDFLRTALLLVLLVAVIMALPGSIPAASAKEPPKTEKVQMLFVQNAQHAELNNNKLILKGMNPTTLFFSDRPDRIAGHMPTAEILPLWKDGKDSFTADPPNATLSIFNKSEVTDVVVELRNPMLKGDELTYDVKVLNGPAIAKGGPCSLFIDIIGMPMTPMSYAGAARRTAVRRSTMYHPHVVVVR